MKATNTKDLAKWWLASFIIRDKKNKLINADSIDGISNEISDTFDKLLDLEFNEEKWLHKYGN